MFSRFEVVELSDKALQRGGPMAEYVGKAIGRIERVHTEWEPNDIICWDYTVFFKDRFFGVHESDLIPPRNG